MPYQTGQNVSVRYKVQSARGTPASGAGAKELPLVASPGLRLSKSMIDSPEVRSDGMRSIGRHGSRSVAGSYTTVLRVGAQYELFEALFRSTWTAAFTVTEATMTSITTPTTSTIVAAAGSWITQGVKVGDVVRLTNHSTAGNNSINLLVTAVTASTLTVAGAPLTVNAVADTAFTLSVAKRLGQGVVSRYFTFEEYHTDIDQSETFTDCMVSSADFALQPDGSVQVTFGIVGINAVSNASGASPVFTAPTQYQGANLVAVDATILKDGVAVTDLTGFSLNMDMAAQLLAVIGATTSPDVFPNNTAVSGSISAPRADLAWLDSFIAETEHSFLLHLVEPESQPKDHLTLFLPLTKLMESPDAPLGGDGPMIGSMALGVGKKPATSGFLETMVQLSTSAA